MGSKISLIRCKTLGRLDSVALPTCNGSAGASADSTSESTSEDDESKVKKRLQELRGEAQRMYNSNRIVTGAPECNPTPENSSGDSIVCSWCVGFCRKLAKKTPVLCGITYRNQ